MVYLITKCNFFLNNCVFFIALHSTVVVQPVMISQDPTDACFNALMNDDERGIRFKNRLYNNPTVQQNLHSLVPFFDRKGLLEVNQTC